MLSRELVRIYNKISRNTICPCLSGKKIKNCDCGFIEKMDDRIDINSDEILRGNIVVGKLKPKEQNHE